MATSGPSFPPTKGTMHALYFLIVAGAFPCITIDGNVDAKSLSSGSSTDWRSSHAP